MWVHLLDIHIGIADYWPQWLLPHAIAEPESIVANHLLSFQLPSTVIHKHTMVVHYKDEYTNRKINKKNIPFANLQFREKIKKTIFSGSKENSKRKKNVRKPVNTFLRSINIKLKCICLSCRTWASGQRAHQDQFYFSSAEFRVIAYDRRSCSLH